LRNGVHYWACGFPEKNDCLLDGTVDGGLWRQKFTYQDLAHIIIPTSFYWERFHAGTFNNGTKEQNLHLLSERLNSSGIQHRKTDLLIEIKLY
jgi:hypothetical protein